MTSHDTKDQVVTPIRLESNISKTAA